MHQRLSTTIVALLLAASAAFAQNECADYHKFNCDRSTDTRFSVNGQSKSASVQIGVPTRLNIIVYRGQDYRISFCYDDKIIGDHVVARLLEKVRVPKEEVTQRIDTVAIPDEHGNQSGLVKQVTRTDKKTVFEDEEKVLWDNQEHEMADAIEFTATSTKRLMVEVTAPGAVNAKPRKNDKGFDIGCVGILIEHMPTPVTGFAEPK